MSRYRIEFEFDYFKEDDETTTHQDVIDCIEEDVPVAIKNAIENITGGTLYEDFRIVKLK